MTQKEEKYFEEGKRKRNSRVLSSLNRRRGGENPRGGKKKTHKGGRKT